VPDTFMTETDASSSETPVHVANPQCWYDDLDTDWDEDRMKRDKAYDAVLARRNPNKFKEGIEAYRRDLPQLLRDQKDRWVVAYDGDTRIGIATTREQLIVALKQIGIANHDSLFIKIVSGLGDKRESMSSHGER
jgi:hypothetical protein